jgi:hypothetical protein
MSQNLITAGVIDPAQLPSDQVQIEVAAVLKISPQQIECLECWPHQIWVKILDGRVKFVSYRSLPLWIEQGFAAIANCGDRYRLNQLGDIFRTETQQYHEHYEPEAVQQWRIAWAKQAQQLRELEARRAAEEERLRPIRAHQQAGKEWQESWRNVLRYCRDCDSLERLAPEMKQQSQEFADLPDVVGAITLMWYQRWQELNQASA